MSGWFKKCENPKKLFYTDVNFSRPGVKSVAGGAREKQVVLRFL